MRNYRIDNGIVVEIVTPVDGFQLEQCFTPEFMASVVPGPDTVQIGWLYNGKIFSAPTAPEMVQPIPTITPRQLELWLLSRGVLAQVNALIDALPEPDKSVAEIEWKRSSVFEYSHPLVQSLGSAVGLTPDDIEAGFREAATL